MEVDILGAQWSRTCYCEFPQAHSLSS